jgi:hypothetical protein
MFELAPVRSVDQSSSIVIPPYHVEFCYDRALRGFPQQYFPVKERNKEILLLAMKRLINLSTILFDRLL